MFFPIARFVVDGKSMQPTFGEGEHLLINKLLYKIKKPQKGDIIVLRDPRDKQRLLLKRVFEIQKDKLEVISDNIDGSDSRTFGSVNIENVVGKVFFRY
ncbi:MAG: signal peptidase I [Candidatus Terrybacteria bacterium RIFCSPLOWO2_01_FULL_40_23]|uniref:Signal peptidase I n=1 Tax=Candidatus Terrybacteria bacterium RIFCSPLOWO2_01_FULL_40_23 TaxID=1802366 RepID=A0A1G2PQD1_9BACT|nr:MAG: signal peptidase I [Candidatus Terrybacteria bacterium RIFCSPLOWO2_01_FULL_40_23]